MPWMNGQMKPIVNAAVTGPRKRMPQCLMDLTLEFVAVIFFVFALLINAPKKKEARRANVRPAPRGLPEPKAMR